MRIPEYYEDKQSIPRSRRDISAVATIPETLRIAIYYRDFDGGQIGYPDEFNDYLDPSFDGGEL